MMGLSSKERHSRAFGDNKLLGNKGDKFFDKPIDQQVAEVAWSEACPVPKGVMVRNGAEIATKRYGEIIFARQLIWEAAKKNNKDLYRELTKNRKRRSGEPMGTHENENVPKSHPNEIVANNTPWGYGLPRVLVVQFGPRGERTSDGVMEGLQILDETITQSKSPLEFMAIFAERVANAQGNVDQVLKCVLSNGYLGENNTYTDFRLLLEQMRENSPKLMARYNQLNASEKKNLGIADIN